MLSLALSASAGVEERTPALRAGASVETTSFPKIFDLQVTFGLDTCTGVRCQCTAGRFAAAYSTNGYLLKQTVGWLDLFQNFQYQRPLHDNFLSFPIYLFKSMLNHSDESFLARVAVCGEVSQPTRKIC